METVPAPAVVPSPAAFVVTGSERSPASIFTCNPEIACPTSLNSSRLYTASSNSWASTTGNMAVAQEDHTATPVTISSQSRVLVVGVNAPSAQLYNPSTQQWTALPAAGQPAVPRRAHAALFVNSGIVIAGGINAGGQTIASAEVFNQTTSTFRRTASLRFARAFHSGNGVSTGDAVVGASTAFGGNTAEFYNSLGLWVPLPNLATGRTVWGANHNFYNTEWQVSDPRAVCLSSASLPGTRSPRFAVRERRRSPSPSRRRPHSRFSTRCSCCAWVARQACSPGHRAINAAPRSHSREPRTISFKVARSCAPASATSRPGPWNGASVRSTRLDSTAELVEVEGQRYRASCAPTQGAFSVLDPSRDAALL